MKDDSFEQIRRDYDKHALSEQDLHANPYVQLKQWLQAACDAGCIDATAMTLATVDSEHHPDIRVVLLKKCDEKTITFFTHLESTKGQQLERNPFVAVNLYWPTFERQVRIKGKVSRLPDQDADDYFASRPKKSQIATYLSKQSEVITDRNELEQAYQQLSQQFQNKPVPRPGGWGGYQIQAHYFEFWQGRVNRLHDRFAYEQIKEGWKVVRLAP